MNASPALKHGLQQFAMGGGEGYLFKTGDVVGKYIVISVTDGHNIMAWNGRLGYVSLTEKELYLAKVYA